MKSGARAEIGKQARLRRDKKKKTLAAAKTKLKNIESKFENSKETKKLKKEDQCCWTLLVLKKVFFLNLVLSLLKLKD